MSRGGPCDRPAPRALCSKSPAAPRSISKKSAAIRDGDRYRVNVKLTDAVFVSPPPAPVIVSGNVPSVAVLLVVIVSVEEVAVAGFGLNDAVAPDPNPVTDNVTPLVNPPLREIETVYVVLLPRFTDRDNGDAERVKFAVTGAVTTSVTVVVCASAPLVPVTVSV
jgi:hypothetical protein